MVELLDSTIAGVAVKRPEQMITKVDGNPMSYLGCAKCKSTLRNIETFRRADGNVLQLLTCKNVIINGKKYGSAEQTQTINIQSL